MLRINTNISAQYKLFLRAGLVALSLGVTAMASQAETVLKAVMHSDLRVIDPIVNTAQITRNHAFMIYDVLVAKDSKSQVRPQMADWQISDDGLIYTFTLRDGLKFHDGATVTSKDVIASLKRWGKRDNGGQLLLDVTEKLEATNEKVITWTLKKPFPLLLDVLAKEASNAAYIMPERIANTPSDTPITEFIGSGPFKLVVSEFKPGLGVLYEKFNDYVPRNEPADGFAGGKVVYVDKVQWITMPDSQTAINALANAEVDYVEQVPVDLMPILEGDDNIIVEKRDPLGQQTMGRMNFKYPPFDNQKIRQAAFYAISQEPILASFMSDPNFYQVCGAVLGCGTVYGSEVGSETLTHGGDLEKAKALLKEAGYDGTPVVIMQPTDVATASSQPVVVAQQLREVGFNVDLQTMDFQTLTSRRTSMADPKAGGWNMFFSFWSVYDVSNPLLSAMLSGRGDGAWFGWPKDDEIEKLKQDFVSAPNLEARKEIAVKIQQHVMDYVLYIPLGEYQIPQGRRKNITDMLPTPAPVFWNVKKAE